jgi:hypothetical protein
MNWWISNELRKQRSKGQGWVEDTTFESLLPRYCGHPMQALALYPQLFIRGPRSSDEKITIDAVTRIEGHAKISIQLDDSGQVASTQLHVTQVRGFEKFTEGRPYYEMPSITARICGICPISHLLASSKACDAIMSVRIP